MIKKYDTLLKKYKMDPKTIRNHNLEREHISSIISAQNLSQKAPAIVSKRIESEVKRRPQISPPYASFSPGVPGTTSQAKYAQFETFDSQSNLNSQYTHKLSVESLRNLKQKRSDRRNKFKLSRASPIKDLTPLDSPKRLSQLPTPGLGNTKQLNKSQFESSHLKALSIDSQNAASPLGNNRPRRLYTNLWTQERQNSIRRYRQTEEMKGVLSKQKIEHNEQKRLQDAIRAQEYMDMQGRIRSYQEELRNEARQRSDKRNKEVAIMEESKSLHQRNLLIRKHIDTLDNMKESPKYLEQREQQEKELRRKRSLERKQLDFHYKQNIAQSKR